MSARRPDLLPPRRLVDGEGALADLLSRANREFEVPAAETEAFYRATQRRAVGLAAASSRESRWRPSAGAFLVFAGTALGCFVAALLVLGRPETQVLSLQAEPPRRAPVAFAPAREATGAVADEERGERAPPSAASRREPEPQHADPRAHSQRAVVPPELTETRRALDQRGGAPGASQQEITPRPDCLELARAGKARAAEACFLERAAGATIGAEMALYEVARLRRDVLADPAGALEALITHQRRFPNGNLRREVALSQIELLAKLGRHQDALRESDALLRSPLGRERALELHVLRGHIYRRKLGDLTNAAREYAAAEGAGGPAAAEASYLAGVCAHELGQREQARAAFQRYLASGQSKHREVARRTLEELSR